MSGGLFGVGSGEIILVLLIILLVMGPDRLPQIVRIWGKISRFVSKFSNTWTQMNVQMMRQLDEEAKPVQDALRMEKVAPPAPPAQATPPDPDLAANTIAPPEFAEQSEVISQSPAPEAETAEASDV